MTEEPHAAVPGWYGKLPSLGDFATRRLPVEFVKPWDAWLQDVIPASRDALAERWFDCYLTMPIWRFVFLPGLVTQSGWAGVLMPSVDRVGRHFPLTVAMELSSHAAAARAVFEGAEWFAGLEDAALAVLDPDAQRRRSRRARSRTASLAAPPTVGPDGSSQSLRALPSVEAFGPLAEGEALARVEREHGLEGALVDARPRGRRVADARMRRTPDGRGVRLAPREPLDGRYLAFGW